MTIKQREIRIPNVRLQPRAEGAMIVGPKKSMGRFSIEFEAANYRDMVAAEMGHLEGDKVRRLRLRGVVDTAASHLVLPGAAVKQLGLQPRAKVKVRYAGGRRAERDNVDDVYLEILGRHGTFSAIIEPRRKDALIGAIVLEAFDLLPDCIHQKLVPRDPRYVTSAIE